MKTIVPTLALAALLAQPGFAEDKEEIDIEARKRSVVTLEGHIKEREERLSYLAKDIIQLDNRVETQLQRIVDKLSGIGDSEDSKWKVSQTKQKAMEGLARTAREYQQKRNELVQKMKEGSTNIPAEVLAGDVKSFDEHIDKRVDQILEISKSFTQDANVEKYEKVEGVSYNYWGGDVYAISDEYKQNRRARIQDKKQHQDVVEALEKAVARLEQMIAGHNQTLKENRLSKAENEIIQAEVENYERLLSLRYSQLSEMREVSPPSTQELQMDEAMDFQDALRDAVTDLRRDYNSIFEKYAELNRQRDRLFRLKENLEARKKWLADYEAKQEPSHREQAFEAPSFAPSGRPSASGSGSPLNPPEG